ncbi:hypothetical protein SK128_018557 [Halocaridina rubra]|uniref:Uncharacterized protein n=1 Tax=Halocaridina rubra TaxID=373956 RepID=A0AAN8X8K4_HALRR
MVLFFNKIPTLIQISDSSSACSADLLSPYWNQIPSYKQKPLHPLAYLISQQGNMIETYKADQLHDDPYILFTCPNRDWF